MYFSLEFHNGRGGSQTWIRVGARCLQFTCLLLCLLGFACRSTVGPVKSLAEGSQRTALLLVGVPAGQGSPGRAIAQVLTHRMRADGLSVLIFTNQVPSSELMDLGPQSSSGPLKWAWDAYYQFKFKEAADLAHENVGRATRGSREWARARVLLALVYYAQGQKKQTQVLLQELSDQDLCFELSPQWFPPGFIALSAQADAGVAHYSELEPGFYLANSEKLSSLDGLTRRTASQEQWQGVWLLRLVPIGWNWRADLRYLDLKVPTNDQTIHAEFSADFNSKRVADALWKQIVLR